MIREKLPCNDEGFKETLARDFLLEFFKESTLYETPISRPKLFGLLSCVREVIRSFREFTAVGYSGYFESPLQPTATIL
jgi:hypothetical protein